LAFGRASLVLYSRHRLQPNNLWSERRGRKREPPTVSMATVARVGPFSIESLARCTAELSTTTVILVQGSGKKPYELTNEGGSPPFLRCSCPAWFRQSKSMQTREPRTCKHLKALLGERAEAERLACGPSVGGPGSPPPAKRRKTAAAGRGEEEEVVVLDEDGVEEPAAAGPASSAPKLLLAQSWDNKQNVAGWLVSEKLDGVRAYWDGERFLSRTGLVYTAPAELTRGLPADIPLDGELYIGRKRFDETSGACRSGPTAAGWGLVTYMVFDAPSHKGPFEARLEAARNALAAAPGVRARVVDHTSARDNDHVQEMLEEVEQKGGEGLMLRQPRSAYAGGRSATLLKVKTFTDCDAVVVAHIPGKGKHEGKMGALSVREADGTVFDVGTGFSDAQRAAPPPVGSHITVKFFERTKAGKPRFPVFSGVRAD